MTSWVLLFLIFHFQTASAQCNCTSCVFGCCLNSCNSGFLVKWESVCKKCVASCDADQYNNSGTCTNCNGECATCNGGSSNNCTSCPAGRYQSGSSCPTCTAPCATCITSATNCQSCMDSSNMTLNSGNCSCNASNRFFNGSNCATCTPPCASCVSSATNCQSCMDAANMTFSGNSCSCTSSNKYFNGSVCANCTSPCTSCSTSATNCTGCISGRYLSGNSCPTCTPPCATCVTSATNCQSCLDSTNMTLSSNTCSCTNPSQFFNGTNCFPCTPPCASCSGTATSCNTCLDAANMTWNSTPKTCTCTIPTQYFGTTTCLNCQSPCTTCTSLAACTNCIPGKYLSGSSCLDCSTPCITCQGGPTYCTQCIDTANTQAITGICTCLDATKYFDGSLCQPCSKPCYSCSGSNTTCQSCYDSSNMSLASNTCTCTDASKYFNMTSSTCQPCTSPCATCEIIDTRCLSCIPSYYLSGTVCLPCTPPCATCIGTATFCQSCFDSSNMTLSSNQCSCSASNKYFDGTACLPCTLPCSQCVNTSTHCTGCIDSTYHTLSGTNQCTCPADRYFDGTSSCQPCTPPCASCITTTATCTVCFDSANMTLANDLCTCTNVRKFFDGSICTFCQEPCFSCVGQMDYCLSCVDAALQDMSNNRCDCQRYYYLSTADFHCYPCVAPCLECISPTQCLTCISNHFISGYDCLKCMEPCIECEFEAQHCSQCVDQIMLIDSEFQCICPKGYLLEGFACVICEKPCHECANYTNICLTCADVNHELEDSTCKCADGYFEEFFICLACELPCTKCVGRSNFCLECVDPFHELISGNCICASGTMTSIVDSNYCQVCIFPCASCSVQPHICNSCMDSGLYTLTNQTCVCSQGYYNNGNQCYKCNPECLKCQNTSDYCTECSDLRHSLVNGSCLCNQLGQLQTINSCLDCLPPCESCFQQTHLCLTCLDEHANSINFKCICEDGYFKEGPKCEKCFMECATCRALFDCQSCAPGFFKVENFCIKCQTFCRECLSETSCIRCENGYFLSENQCVKCIENCEQCNSASGCQVCKDGYYYQHELGKCTPCSISCKTCIDQGDNCSSCSSSNAFLKKNELASTASCQCVDMYFLEATTQTCLPCPRNCLKCEGPHKCEECLHNPSVEMLDGFCSCKSGYYMKNLQCEFCDKRCASCLEFNQCTSCAQNRELTLDRQCLCQKGFIESAQGDCLKCDSFEGQQHPECKYFNCGDKVWTFGEECDDGNNISRDGCTNCLRDQGYFCQNKLLYPSVCQPCQENCNLCDSKFAITFCTECNQGYFLSSGVCQKCSHECITCRESSKSCILCRYLVINGNCVQCSDKIGYFTDSRTDTCTTRCGDGIKADIEQCDDGNKLNRDGCDENCRFEVGFKCAQGSVCKETVPPTAQLKQEQAKPYDNTRIFLFSFDQPLNQKVKLAAVYELMKIKIIGEIVPDKFEYSIILNQEDRPATRRLQGISEDVAQVSFTIQLTLSSSIKQAKLQVSIAKQNEFMNSEEALVQQLEYEAPIDDYFFISNLTVAATTSAITSNFYILISLGIIVGISILFGGLGIFFNLLDTLQLISYLQFVNTVLPYNLKTFLDVFDFAQLKLLENLFDIQKLFLNDKIPQHYLDSAPKKILDDDISPLFIANIVSIASVWGTFFFIFFLSKSLLGAIFKVKIELNQSEGPQKIKIKLVLLMIKLYFVKILATIQREFLYSGMIRTHLSTAFDYAFAVALSFKSMGYESRNTIIQLSDQLALIAFGLYLFMMFFVASCCSNYVPIYENKQYLSQYGSAYEGTKPQTFCKQYNTFLLGKKFLFISALVLFYDYPLYQIINMALYSLMHTWYLIYIKPLRDPFEYKKQLCCETFLTLTQAILFIFILDDEFSYCQPENREDLGWAAIAFISFILVFQLIFDAYQQWVYLYNHYKTLRAWFHKIAGKFGNYDNKGSFCNPPQEEILRFY